MLAAALRPAPMASITVAAPVTMAFNYLAAIIRALGDSKTPLLFLMIACFVRLKPFFRGETLNADTPILVPDTGEPPRGGL